MTVDSYNLIGMHVQFEARKGKVMTSAIDIGSSSICCNSLSGRSLVWCVNMTQYLALDVSLYYFTSDSVRKARYLVQSF